MVKELRNWKPPFWILKIRYSNEKFLKFYMGPFWALLKIDRQKTPDIFREISLRSDPTKARLLREPLFGSDIHKVAAKILGSMREGHARSRNLQRHSLSLQMHHHLAEQWVVVEGKPEVTNGDDTFLMSENQSSYIPIRQTHRLANPGKQDLVLIEVGSDCYLGEDDIVRFYDVYARN